MPSLKRKAEDSENETDSKSHKKARQEWKEKKKEMKVGKEDDSAEIMAVHESKDKMKDNKKTKEKKLKDEKRGKSKLKPEKKEEKKERKTQRKQKKVQKDGTDDSYSEDGSEVKGRVGGDGDKTPQDTPADTPIASDIDEPLPKHRRIEIDETQPDIDIPTVEIPENLRFSTYRLSTQTIKSLESRGIMSLFPIQAATFNHIFDGKDILARARTGTGKTLAFALPMIEKLDLEGDTSKKRGRAPRVIVMAPTRDLAKQVAAEFETTSAGRLKALCVYGGVPYDEQYKALRDGLDIIVGTPGRILDHIERGTLNLSEIKFMTLDEADQMLDMGFAPSMNKCLEYLKEHKGGKTEIDYQTLLFSATVPEWVLETVKKYLRKDYIRVDLIGNSKNKTNENIRHIAIPSTWQSRKDIIGDVVTVYGRGGLSVIFSNTKAEANELGLNEKLKQDTQVLHGDIQQQQREITLKGFREGKFKCIICTDVLARGLDIPDVDLVISCSPPKDVESYVHRSGRTGRAGRNGVSVVFYKPQEESLLQYIQRRTGVQFEIISAPQPRDIIAAAIKEAMLQINSVSPQVLPFFADPAQTLVEAHGAEKAVSLALALISGYASGLPTRSLMTATEGYTTLIFKLTHTIQHPGYVRNILKRYPTLAYEDVKGMRMAKSMDAVVFDIISSKLEVRQENGKDVILLGGSRWVDTGNVSLIVANALPELEQRDDGRGQNMGRGGYSNNRGGGNSWGGSRGGEEYSSGRYSRAGRNGPGRNGYGNRR